MNLAQYLRRMVRVAQGQSHLLRVSAIRVTAVGIGTLGAITVARLGGPEIKGTSAAFAAGNSLVATLIALDVAQQIAHDCRVNGVDGRSRPLLAWAWGMYASASCILLVAATVLGSSTATWLILGALAYLVPTQAGIVALASSGSRTVAVGAIIQQSGLLAAVLAFWGIGALNETTVKFAVVLGYLAPLPYFWRLLPPWEWSTLRGRTGLTTILGAARGGLSWQVGRLSQMALFRMDVMALSVITGPAAAGVYSVGLSLASLVGLIPQVVSADVYHHAHQQRDVSPLRQAVKIITLTAAAAIPLVVLGKPLISIAFGSAFTESYWAMLAALPGVVAFGVVQVCTSYVRVHGTAGLFAAYTLPGSLVMLGALLVLIPSLTVVGAGIAFSIGSFTSAGVGLYISSRLRQ